MVLLQAEFAPNTHRSRRDIKLLEAKDPTMPKAYMNEHYVWLSSSTDLRPAQAQLAAVKRAMKEITRCSCLPYTYESFKADNMHVECDAFETFAHIERVSCANISP